MELRAVPTATLHLAEDLLHSALAADHPRFSRNEPVSQASAAGPHDGIASAAETSVATIQGAIRRDSEAIRAMGATFDETDQSLAAALCE